jgi:hypothetical protein
VGSCGFSSVLEAAAAVDVAADGAGAAGVEVTAFSEPAVVTVVVGLPPRESPMTMNRRRTPSGNMIRFFLYQGLLSLLAGGALFE